MSRKGDKGGLSLVGLRRNALLGLLVCALLRGALLLWIGIGDPGTCVLFALAGGALVPRLIGSFEPFVQVMSVAPDLLALFQLSDYVPSALGRESSFALPRVGGRRLWAGEKCLQLAACVAIYETASASAVLAMMVFLSGAAPAVLAALLLPVLQCVLLDFALLLVLLLCANLLALGRETIVAFATVAGVHVAALLALSAVPGDVAKSLACWLPSARGVPAWHLSLCELCGNASDVAVDMSLAVSAAVLLALSAALALALIRLVRGTDLI